MPSEVQKILRGDGILAIFRMLFGGWHSFTPNSSSWPSSDETKVNEGLQYGGTTDTKGMKGVTCFLKVPSSIEVLLIS